MSAITLVSDADLARARHDPAFRHEFVAGNLQFLLTTLNRLRSTQTDPKSARQIREGVALAVQLAELLQRITGSQADMRRVG
jgi:hypothetical protein